MQEQSQPRLPPPSADDNGPITLRVALFPYAPYLKTAEALIAKAWKAVRPDVSIEFVYWDGYASDPSPHIDVLEFDAVLLERFLKANFLAPLHGFSLPKDDLLPCAFRACHVDNTIYGASRYVCAPVLFYREGDKEIENAKSMEDLATIIRPHEESHMPPAGHGLMVDFTEPWMQAFVYHAIASVVAPPSDWSKDFHPAVLEKMRMMARMAGKNASYADPTIDRGNRARWFREGRGRALYDYPERSAIVGAPNVRVRALPVSQCGRTSTLFVDVVCLSQAAAQSPEKQSAALAFIALLTTPSLVREVLFPPAGSRPAHEMPAHRSLWQDESIFIDRPYYRALYEMANYEHAEALQMGPHARELSTSLRDLVLQ